MTAKLRWGILGTGNIARQFTAGLNACQRGVAAAVGSRTASSAHAFAKSFNIPAAHSTYEALLADPGIDVIYNSLPNSLHHHWTIESLRAGKHVLCEKPLALTAIEAEQMFDAAARAGRILMEAFMYRSHPQTLAVIDAVRQGAIGELRLIRASFCYRTRRIEGNVRFVRELGGGSLMDIGCYCIHFARLFAAAEPLAIHAVAQFNAQRVDDLAAGTLLFPSGIVSSFTCGMCLHADNTACLCGSDGFIEIPVPWKPMPGQAKFILTHGSPPKMDNAPPTSPIPPRDVHAVQSFADLYAIEADDFASTILDGHPPRITREDSLGNMRVLDEMRRQIGLEF